MKWFPISETSPERRWRVPVILFLFTLLFYWKVLFTNRSMFPWDAADFFYPYLAFIHEELRHFHVPLWDPFVMSGFPIIGDPEAQIFYPINWLMVLAHPFSHLTFKSVEVVEIIHFYLAGLFMYWLAKDYTKDELASLLGGMLFMSSGAMVAHTQHFASVEAMAWYPLVFLLARRGLLEKSFFWTLCAGLFMGLEILVGHWQHAVYLGLLLFLYFAYEACMGSERRRLWPHWIWHLSMIAAIGAGLAMVQIIPTAQLGRESIRTYLSYPDVVGGIPPTFLWTLFLPNIFGGLKGIPYTGHADPSFNYAFITVPACLLALVGLVARARRRDYFWFALLLLTIELALGSFGFLGMLVCRIPVLNLFRQMSVFFDLGNLALCLMAAVGAQALLDRNSRPFYRRWVPIAPIALLFVAIGAGVRYSLAATVHGWYHMLVVLALSAVLFSAWLYGWLRPRIAATAVLLLMAVELCHYSMNQWFNREANNPRRHVSYEYAAQRKESLQFLRADPGADFRIAPFDGSPWGSNAPNVWRLPSIFGWNPVMLSNYQDTIRQFIHVNNSAQPFGGPDHVIGSALVDLFGVKYVLAIGPVESEMRLADNRKFEKVFAEPDWRAIYRNKDYLSRSWFYPRAYVLPDRAAALALMTSHWFETRHTLLLAAPDLPGGHMPLTEPLQALTLLPEMVTADNAGGVARDLDCSLGRSAYKYWDGTGKWIRFDLGEGLEPSRYSLLAEYVAKGPTKPMLKTEVSQDGQPPASGAVSLPRTTDMNCKSTRSAELGEFDLISGPAKVTITHLNDPPVDLFALRLVRLPPDPSRGPAGERLEEIPAHKARDFSFRDFDVTTDDYAFTADLRRDGFVLVNEVYYPGWEATVDGRPADLLPGDYVFRALSVPAGSHRIVMRFRQKYLGFAALISLLTLGGLIGYFVVRPRAGRPAAAWRAQAACPDQTIEESAST